MYPLLLQSPNWLQIICACELQHTFRFGALPQCAWEGQQPWCRLAEIAISAHGTFFADETATTGDTTVAVRAGAAREARVRFGSNAGTYDVGLQRDAAGGILNVMDAGTTATNYRPLRASAVITAPTTVSTLPSSPTDGMRGFVTDATTTTFAATVTGGGSNHVPVYYDGSASAWKIG